MILLPLAYMNPGTGGLLLQMVVVGTSIAFLAIRSVWHTIKSLWSRKK